MRSNVQAHLLAWWFMSNGLVTLKCSFHFNEQLYLSQRCVANIRGHDVGNTHLNTLHVLLWCEGCKFKSIYALLCKETFFHTYLQRLCFSFDFDLNRSNVGVFESHLERVKNDTVSAIYDSNGIFIGLRTCQAAVHTWRSRPPSVEMLPMLK